ncbi:MAG: hypothetical protein KDE23_18180 [Caldilinea sp.]|nr:hypothetical protein [Caldilinea sp.]
MQAPPTIDIWYGSEQRFGHCGQPQRWANILGRVRSDQPIRQLTCTLNGGAARPLSMGPDARRLAAPGDFNIDLDCRDLAPGANTIVVAATDGAGLTTMRTVTLTVAGDPCPLPYTIDWARVEQIQDVAHVVDGRWTCGAHGVSPLEIGYDRLLAIGDMAWRNYEVLVPITVHGINAACFQYPSVHAGVGVIMRWKGHANWGKDEWASGQPCFGPSPYGAIGWYCVFHDAGPMLNLFDPDFQRTAEVSRTLALHVPYLFRVRVEPGEGVRSLYSLKVWPAHEAEPAAWDLRTLGSYAGLSEGAIMLGAHHTAATFGNVTVTPLP